MKDTDCEPTDQECICADKKLQAGVTKCVTVSCTVKESLSTKTPDITDT